ncbi:hypothetical protein [Octadecabacter algicola]|nr:hypothetical protein [Octadecabacter algicola]
MEIGVLVAACGGAFLSGVALMYLVMMRTIKKRAAEAALVA